MWCAALCLAGFSFKCHAKLSHALLAVLVTPCGRHVTASRNVIVDPTEPDSAMSLLCVHHLVCFCDWDSVIRVFAACLQQTGNRTPAFPSSSSSPSCLSFSSPHLDTLLLVVLVVRPLDILVIGSTPWTSAAASIWMRLILPNGSYWKLPQMTTSPLARIASSS